MNKQSIELPLYKCHKEVHALKIKEVHHNPNPDETGMTGACSYGAVLIPEDSAYGAIEVNATYMIQHKPVAGGYYVVYKGGYQSFSPADAFEEGYSRI